MSPILTAGLPAAGLTRTFPRAIVHGPWQWGGLNIPNLFTEQIMKHVHTILKFSGNTSDMTGILLQASCEAFRLEAGLLSNIANLSEVVYTYVTSTWVSQTWESCRKYNIQILGNHGDLTLPCQNDVELMRLFIRAGYRKTELNTLNQCRMYLQVVFLSDICEATGYKMEQYLWKQPHVTESVFRWPKIHKPTTSE